MTVLLTKEPENEYDNEAIAVTMPGLDKIGYVANSVHTVKGESCSSGRMYDHMGRKATGTVIIVLPDAVICRLDKSRK